MSEQRKKNEDSLLLALACGATVEAAARQCGLTERTIYRRLKDAAFKARLQAVRSDMVGRSAGLLTAAASEAVRTLLALQKESAPPAVRLGAARAVLEVGMKLREVVDLQTRMDELEELVSTLQKQQPQNAWN
jgi:hypothetical protein